MRTRYAIATGLTVIGLAVSANQVLEPRTMQEINQEYQDRQLDNAGDAQERSNETKRDDGTDHLNAENKQKVTPVEPRPGEKPRLRIRIP